MPPKSDNTKSKDTKADGSKSKEKKAEDTKAENLVIYLGFGKRRGKSPLHWMFIYAPEGEEEVCTWVHVTGGPKEGYKLKIEAGKRLKSFGIASKEVIGMIPAKEEKKIKAAAQAVPLQRCQRWTTALVAILEKKDLLAKGTAASLEQRIEPREEEEDEKKTGGSAASGGDKKKTGESAASGGGKKKASS